MLYSRVWQKQFSISKKILQPLSIPQLRNDTNISQHEISFGSENKNSLQVPQTLDKKC